MFLRKKKVGSSYYFQLVESSRTKDGPRLKIHATLGRADHLEESGKLDRLAANFAKYSQSALLLSRAGPADAIRLPAAALQDLVVRKVLAMDGLLQPVKSFVSGSSTPADLRHALRQALFEPGAVTSTRVLRSILGMGGHAEAVATLISGQCDATDQELFVYVDKHPAGVRRMSLLSGSITVTAVNSAGHALMFSHWLEYLQFPEMLRQQLDRFRSVLDKDRIVLVLGRSLINPRLIGYLTNQRIAFVAPLHEPGALLGQIPGQVVEEKPESPPFEDIRTLRYVRAVDNHVAMKERQVREFQQARIRGLMAANPMQARMHHDALSRMDQVARFDGTTLLATNLEETSPRDILQAYLLGQRGRRFQHQAAAYLARLSISPDLPRDIEPLFSGGLTLQLLAAHLAERIAEIVSGHLGQTVQWPAIAFALNHELPLVLGEEQAALLAIPADSAILKAVLDALAIETGALIRSAGSSARQRKVEPAPLDEVEKDED